MGVIVLNENFFVLQLHPAQASFSPDYLTPLWAIGLPPLQRATASRDTSPVRQAVLHPVQAEISGTGLDQPGTQPSSGLHGARRLTIRAPTRLLQILNNAHG